MRETLERELKLDVDASFELPPLDGEPLAERVFTSTYHDTPARSLARAGITLRRRVENGLSLWQLKLPRDGGARAELEAPGGPAGPPPELARLLVTHLRHGPLQPVATLRTRRSGVRVADGGRAVADVTVDAVDVLDAGRSAGGFVELEAELVDGGGDDLERIGRALLAAGARPGDGRPKLMRVLELDGRAEPTGSTLTEQLRALLERQLLELEAHDPGARLGGDPEDVHKLRVATRRARALERAARPLLRDRLAGLAAELEWLGGELGAVRDFDVLVDRLDREVEALGSDAPGGRELLAALVRKREAQRGLLLQALDSERYPKLLCAFEDALLELPELDGDAKTLARRALAKLRSAAGRLPDDPADEELHALRIRAKRARYAGELAALGGGKAIDRYVEALKDVQDLIGEHQDLVVLEQTVRGLARARSGVAAGRIVERARERRAELRAAYPAVLKAALSAGAKAL
ncbi:MAG TPA: CYTH and CHAD domain-containing protein [Gaiellaceae bacterium]|nr:CYTH and CHAD domain-containing protein [Gaiellaceae bacterium]